MDDSQPAGWWQRHATAAFILAIAAVTTFLIRTIYAYQLISQCNISYCFAGGSDSFYHARVMTWIIQQHTNLIKDPLLNYPLGLNNPREPLFDWMNAILGILFAPLFGGNAVTAGMWFLEMQPPFWAAMGVFPLYFLGKEVSSKRTGLIAAVLYPLFVGSIESTVATYANYLSFYAFFVFLNLAVYIHTVRLSGTRRWVENYISPRSIWSGFKNFARVERNSFNWAVFAGVSFGATMLAWQGYTYVIAVVVVFLAVTLLVERIRRVDSFGTYVVTLIMGTIGFLMAMPYYYVQGVFGYWFGLPMMIFYGAMLALLPFMMLRDTPWLLSLMVMIASIAGAAGGLYLYNKNDFNAVITGQGYFVKTLIYSTVAEAQAPSFDSLIVAYGPITFFLAIIGLMVFMFYLYKFKFRREHVFMVILGLVGIYLPISAAKFFLIGAPLFALLPAEVILMAMDRMGYSDMRHTATSLSQNGSMFFAFKRSFKLRHLFIIIIALGVLLPNVWYAVDAGIPYNEKSTYGNQIYNTLPPAIRSTLGSSSYLGAAGIETDTPTQYDESGYNWLAAQDTNQIPAQRPAFVSWWDYGFQALDQGGHPTVADNFQDGIVPSGHFLLAQNESQAIAVMATTLLYAEQQVSGKPYLPAGLNAQLRADGLNLTTLHNYMVNTSKDQTIVINNPQIYGPVNAGNLQGTGGAENALFFTMDQYLASALNENGVVKVYQDVQSYTGWSIGYAMADTRLFPTSGSNTGIYYAPVDLTDGVIGSGGIPTWYFTVNATGSDGNTYPLGSVPPGVQVVSTSINYNSPFYNSMIYKIFVGYNGTDVGAGTGIPGLSNSLTSYPVQPGWMMQHFMMQYRTAYYCPYKNYTDHPGCFSAVNYAQALQYQKNKQGTVDASSSSYFSGGETILRYYPGATVTGYVALPQGQPMKNIHVTVLDQWGTPHQVVTTNKYGAYTLLAPPGNDTLVVSYGAVGGLQQTGTTLDTVNLTVSNAYALTYNSPAIFEPITVKPASVSGRVYWNVANSTSYSPAEDLPISGATVTLENNNSFITNVTSDVTGTYLATGLPPGLYNVSVSLAPGSSFSTGQVTLSSGENKSQDQAIKDSHIIGVVTSEQGAPVVGAQVTLTSPGQPTQTLTTGNTGRFNFSSLLPAQYSVRAVTQAGLNSAPTVVDLFTEGQNTSVSLTVSTPVITSIRFTYNGQPIPNLPVRFSPLNAVANFSSIAITGTDGVAIARLTPGIWSVYALGAINGTWVTSLSNLEIGNGTQTVSQTFALQSAQVLRGTIYGQGTNLPQNGVQMTLRSSTGAILAAATNSTGRYQLYLPTGTYTILASYAPSGTTPTVAAVGTVALVTPRTFDLTLSAAMSYAPLVGYRASSGNFIALPGTVVTVGFGGNSLQSITNASGYASFILPQVNSTFTVSAYHYGYNLTQPLTLPNQQALLSAVKISMGAVPVEVTLDLVCSGCTSAPTVNFTAVAPPANSTSVTAQYQNGSYVVHAALSPGPYTISSETMVLGNRWSQIGTVSTYVPVGAGPITLPSLTLMLQKPYNGSIGLPPSTNSTVAADAKVLLYSPTAGNITLSGENFTNASSPFYAPPGNYTAWIVSFNGSTPYSFLGNLSFPTQGGALPTVQLHPASNFTFVFTSSYGKTQNAKVNVTLSSASASSNGALIHFASTSSGSVGLTLPNGTYRISVNSTALLNVSGISHFVTFRTEPNPNYCTLNLTSSVCNIDLNTTSALTNLNGVAYLGSQVSGANGLVRILPAGGNASQEIVLPLVQGRFSTALLPGDYTLYTSEDVGGYAEVNVSTLALSYQSTGLNLRLNLSTGWQASLLLSTPPSLPTVSTAVLNVSQDGNTLFYVTGISPNSAYTLSLPAGTWTLSVRASTTMGGVTVPLLANASVPLHQSNAAVNLPLLPQWTHTATLSVTGVTTTTIAGGGNATFSFVVKNTGNSVETLRFKGAPVTWNYTFYPANVTLQPGPTGSSASVSVNVQVPRNTLVTSNSATFEALLNGTAAPLASASVTINLIPRHAITLLSTPSSDIVGNKSLVLGYSVGASGNAIENVTVSVLNGASLNQQGWSYSLTGTFTSLTPQNPATIGTLTLSARIAGAVLPHTVTLLAVDHAAPGLTQTLTIQLPTANLTVPGPLLVTGPSIGSPAPFYMTYLPIVLTIAPAIAIVAFAVGRRWWKTRRWVRK